MPKHQVGKKMYDFAPVPMSALNGKTLSLSAFRLLGHFMGIRTFLNLQDHFSVTDHELLTGMHDRKSATSLPKCELSRNTLNGARDQLKELGYIHFERISSGNGESNYRYTLVETVAVKYREDHQILTPEASNTHALYKEEKREVIPLAALSHLPSSELDCRDHDHDSAASWQPSTDDIVERIQSLYQSHHPSNYVMPNLSCVKAALKRFVKANPGWTTAAIYVSIENIYRSDANFVNKQKSPEYWMARIPEFSVEPKNRYGHSMEHEDYPGRETETWPNRDNLVVQ